MNPRQVHTLTPPPPPYSLESLPGAHLMNPPPRPAQGVGGSASCSAVCYHCSLFSVQCSLFTVHCCHCWEWGARLPLQQLSLRSLRTAEQEAERNARSRETPHRRRCTVLLISSVTSGFGFAFLTVCGEEVQPRGRGVFPGQRAEGQARGGAGHAAGPCDRGVPPGEAQEQATPTATGRVPRVAPRRCGELSTDTDPTGSPLSWMTAPRPAVSLDPDDVGT